MKLNICLLYLFIILSFFYPAFPVSAEESEIFIIEIPEYKNESSTEFIPADEELLLKDIQERICSVFLHFSSGNAFIKGENSSPVISENRIIESELILSAFTESLKGGFFCETELAVYDRGKQAEVKMKYTASGLTEEEAFRNSVSKLPDLLKYRYSDFDEESGFYRILDIYQKEIIISGGEDDGFSRGNYFEILNSRTGDEEGLIILTDTDREISYGRLLYWKGSGIDKNLPETGSRIRRIKYAGLEASVSSVFLADNIFSGTGTGIKLEYFRNIYIFHPFISASVFDIESSLNSYDINILSAGISMNRHAGKLTLFSSAAVVNSWYRTSRNASPDFRGGQVKAGAKYSLTRHMGILAEGGFLKLFAEDDKDHDVGGFLFGGGVSFKY